MPRDRKPIMDDMELESGLADDFEATIQGAVFEVIAAYAEKSGSDDPMLVLPFYDPELDEAGIKPSDSYSLGGKKVWQAINGGAEVVSKISPDSTVFNMNSSVGALINRLIELAGEGNRKKGQEILLARGHFMTEADFYNGIRSHWKLETRVIPGIGEGSVSSTRLYPTKFVKIVDTLAPAKVAEAPSIEIPDEVVLKFAEIAPGKSESELKTVALKEWGAQGLTPNPAIASGIIKGTILRKLEADGILTKGEGGKYA